MNNENNQEELNFGQFITVEGYVINMNHIVCIERVAAYPKDLARLHFGANCHRTTKTMSFDELTDKIAWVLESRQK